MSHQRAIWKYYIVCVDVDGNVFELEYDNWLQVGNAQFRLSSKGVHIISSGSRLVGWETIQ